LHYCIPISASILDTSLLYLIKMSTGAIQILVIITPKPGKEDELIRIAEEGARHHRDEVPTCERWLFSRQFTPPGMPALPGPKTPGAFILTQQWTSMEAAMEHSRTEAAVKSRDQLLAIADGFDFKMSKAVGGFSSK